MTSKSSKATYAAAVTLRHAKQAGDAIDAYYGKVIAKLQKANKALERECEGLRARVAELEAKEGSRNHEGT